MIDAVKMNAEEQSGHLAESEVARLLAVLQNAEFKRSETRNITKDHSFKPRSLMEIAIEAQKRDAEIEAVKQAEEALAETQRAEAASVSKAQAGEDQILDDPNSANPDLDNQDSAIGKDVDGALIAADGAKDVDGQAAPPKSPPSPISEAAPNVTLDTGKGKTKDMAPDMGSGDRSSDLSGNLANPVLANEGLADDAAEYNPIADASDGDTAKGAQIAANFETVTAAFERGKAEGMIAGRDAGIADTKAAAEATAQANLADKIAAFETALLALTKPQALQAEDLSRSIHAAILRLASERAGQKIDDMPENFLARIEALVTSIGQKMTAGKVHINTHDYKIMLPYLADAHFDFVAEPGLARGDIILKFAGVELHDIAETRLGGQYAETVKNIAKAPIEAADLRPKITPAEPTPAKLTPVEGSDASNPAPDAGNPASDNAASDKAETDSAASDNAASANVELDSAASDNAASANVEPDTAASDKAELDNAASDKAELDNAASDKAELDNAASDTAEPDNAASDQAQKDQPPVPPDETPS